MNHLSRICVYCGSSSGRRPEYARAAAALGQEMARRQLELIYGGGSVGIMGVLARTVHALGGRVTGVIPELLVSVAVSGETIGDLVVVENMHVRKATMTRLADAFIAMPGGFGTLEELFETITWNQLGIHAKPVGLLNVAGYFEPVRQVVRHGIDEGFIRPDYLDMLVVAAEPAELLDRLASHRLPAGVLQAPFSRSA